MIGKNPDFARADCTSRSRLSRLAWLPIPVLLALMILFWATDQQSTHESLYLLLTLNLVFSTLVCLFIAYLITRSFLVSAAPGLLLLGCGVVIWGPAGVVATAAARGDVNISITIYNSCVWLSGLCHLTGVALSLRPRRSLSPPALWLLTACALAVGAVMLVTLSSLAGWIPAFFVQEHGGTPVRQIVLISAVAMFAFTAFLLGSASRRTMSAFAHWYALGLLLIAVGLFGVMLQTYHASILGWTGRATQALGGLYMLIAAVASVRESHAWGISLEKALRESEDRYRMLFETAPDAIVVHRDGRFLCANSAALALTGARSFERLARHTVLDFFRPQDHERATERTRMAMTGHRLPPREAMLLRLDGREIAVEFHTAPVDFQGARAIQTIIRDITERKQAEEVLRQALHETQQRCAEISALMTSTRAVLECRDRVSAIHVVFNACRELLGAAAGYVAVLTPDGQNDEVVFLEPDGSSCTVDPSLPMPVRGFRAEVYLAGRVMYHNHFVDSSWAEMLPAGHVRLENVLFAPMIVDGQTIGLLGLGNKPDGFTDHDATLAATFGELVAIALRNSRTLESLRELNATLENKVSERTAELEKHAEQLQKLTLELTQAEDRERKRIAAILHEDVQQHIVGAKFHLSLLCSRLTRDPPQQALAFKIDEMLKGAIEKSRGLSHELSPAVLHMNDLAEILRWLARHMQAKHGLMVRVQIRGEIASPSEAMAMFLFRAVQEMLFNVIKHAGIHEAEIRTRQQGRYLCLSVLDKGCGFNPQELKETPGLGLFSIRERVELLGGRMKIKSAEGEGSTFHIVVPNGEIPAANAMTGDKHRAAWEEPLRGLSAGS